MILLLSGCSGADTGMQQAMEFRSSLLSSEGCRFQTEVTADYGEELYTFSLECQSDRDGNLSFRVTQPEAVADIKGTVSETGGTLSFEDTALSFPLMADEQITPVTAPWILVRTLRSGSITSVCQEEQLLHLSIDDSYEEDALQLDIWLDGENRPVRGEILYDQKRILSMSIVDFVLL